MIRLTRPVRFNYRLQGERVWRFDVLPGGAMRHRHAIDAGGAPCVRVWIGVDGDQSVLVPLAEGEFEQPGV